MAFKKSFMPLVALSMIAASGTLAHGATWAPPALDSINTAQFDENAYYSGFGGPAPTNAIEASAGFSTIANVSGRTIAQAAVTSNTVDNNQLLTIASGLFSGTDVNTYKILVANPAEFRAYLPPASSLILALFDSTGAGVAAARGNGAVITAAAAGITVPGYYYISIANTAQVPQNAAGTPIFSGLSVAPGFYLPDAADPVLATAPLTSFKLAPGATNVLTNTSFLAGSSTISFSGAAFAIQPIPEPASLSLVALAAGGLMLRRRKAAR